MNLEKSHQTQDFNAYFQSVKPVFTKNSVRITQLRRWILKILWQSEKPLGAYAVLDELKQELARKQVAPPTVYRVLDCLVELGLVHKVHSQNAFVLCHTQHMHTHHSHQGNNGEHKHADLMFLCQQCGAAEEIVNRSIQQAINLSASQLRFDVKDPVLEVSGVCKKCKLVKPSH